MALWFGRPKNLERVGPEGALPGRSEAIVLSGRHFVTGESIVPPFPRDTKIAVFGMGCFWGAERIFWQRERCRGHNYTEIFDSSPSQLAPENGTSYNMCRGAIGS